MFIVCSELHRCPQCPQHSTQTRTHMYPLTLKNMCTDRQTDIDKYTYIRDMAFDCCKTNFVAALATAQEMHAKFCSKLLSVVAATTDAVTMTTNQLVKTQNTIDMKRETRDNNCRVM